jgi:hypothetical protein
MRRKDLAELCPVHRHDREEERVICVLGEHVPGAWGLICSGCWEAMLNAKARREEWELAKE